MTETAVCLGLLAPATAAIGLPAAMSLLGRLPRRRRDPQPPHPLPSFAILIPAHDEAASLPAALRSVAAQDYPPDRAGVLVVADNCTDATAAVASANGADVLTRTDATRRGKGYALAAGLEALRDEPYDAVLVLDADCTLNPTALRELAAAFAAGAEVVQASVRSRNADDGPAGFVAAVGAAVDAAVAAGRERVGLRARLRGTGMAFRRSALPHVRWATASPVEDAEYDRQLREAGVRARYCPGAEVAASAPGRLAELCRQRRRWAAAGPLASKPLGLLGTALAVAVCVATGQFLVWGVLLVATAAALYLSAAAEVGVNRRRLGSLLVAPAVVGRLAGVAVAGWLKPVGGWTPAEADPA